jgi:hypothetical protein
MLMITDVALVIAVLPPLSPAAQRPNPLPKPTQLNQPTPTQSTKPTNSKKYNNMFLQNVSLHPDKKITRIAECRIHNFGSFKLAFRTRRFS